MSCGSFFTLMVDFEEAKVIIVDGILVFNAALYRRSRTII